MDLVNAFALIALFVGIYGVLMVIAWAAETVLRKFFNIGMFPKDYFK